MGPRKGGRKCATIEAQVSRETGGKLRIPLVLAKFGQDFCSTAFRAFLLRYGIVGTG